MEKKAMAGVWGGEEIEGFEESESPMGEVKEKEELEDMEVGYGCECEWGLVLLYGLY